jgi:hypothetical protein
MTTHSEHLHSFTELPREDVIVPLSPRQAAQLNAMSLNLYGIYWHYRTWKDMQGKVWPVNISPGLRTLGLFVPLLNIYINYKFFEDILSTIRHKLVNPPSAIVLTFLSLLPIPLDRALDRMGVESVLLSIGLMTFVSSYVIYRFQPVIQAAWAEEGLTEVRTELNRPERIMRTVGLVFWGLMVLLDILSLMIATSGIEALG